MSFESFLMLIELVLLVLIWRDGKGMLRSSLNMEKQYAEWFAERRVEREARRESARKARESKATKAAVVAATVSEVLPDAPVVREPEVGRQKDFPVVGGDTES